MKTNKMTQYAFRIISCLCVEKEGIVTTISIAEKENIPSGVVMKVITILRKNGIVKSHRGRGAISGGFSISRPLEQITCLDIIEIMEGPLVMSEKTMSGDRESIVCECGESRESKDAFQNELERIEHILIEEMSRKTFADILPEPTGSK